MKNQKPFTILVLMNATPQWLSLTREDRAAFVKESVTPVFSKVSDTTTVRLFDSEYFHGVVSDFMIIETTDLNDYQELIERLRDTRIYQIPYFEIKDIILGQENRFEDFDVQLRSK